MPVADRICGVDGCSNLGATNGPGKLRKPLCTTHQRHRWPARAESARRHGRASNKARLADGRSAAGLAAQLLRGEQIWSYANHHLGMRALLGGTVGDGLTVSRTCEGTDCPDVYEGYSHRGGEQIPYPLCARLDHYCLESRQENLARKVPA